jgi:ParB family chromosome partitioning protein
MIETGKLAAHPGNVRLDVVLSAEFAASVAQYRVRIPLLVTTDADGGFRVVEGHRRLAAAVKAGLAEVPCIVDPERAADEAGQFLDMLVANGRGYRQNFSAVEEAAALFSAAEAGASRTRIRRVTGRKADEVRAALKVGGMSAQTRDAAGELAGQLDLDQLVLLAEFDGDADALERLLTALRHGLPVEYTAERIRQDRAEAAEHDRLVAELEAAGTPVTEDLPAGAGRLAALAQGEEELTPEAHGSCPGRGVFFPAWNRVVPVHYCTSPDQYGHAVRAMLRPGAAAGAAAGAGADAGAPGALPDPPAEESPDPGRRLVIEGNKAWQAAGEVRKRWLATVLFARRAAPRQAAPFVARMLLTMPDPVRTGLPMAPGRLLMGEVTGASAATWLETCDTAAAARLPLLMLAPIVAAFEQAMTEGEGKSTWRADRYSSCPRREAGRYLSFLASAGYQLSAIEQSLADDVPYTGDHPAGPGPAVLLDPGGADSPAPDGGPAISDGEPAAADGSPAADDDANLAVDTESADGDQPGGDNPAEASPEAA